jgi:hypothetical protein
MMAAVADRLTNPIRRLSFEELATAWFTARISARIEGYAALSRDLDLLRRIRGALGQILLESASPESAAGHPCPWDPPCALDVLCREQGRVGAHGIPKPYVLAAEPKGPDLIVSMTLFGFASDWSAAAAHALIAALQHRIDWHGLRPRLFLPRFRLTRVTTQAAEGVRSFPERDLIELQFVTPMNAEGDDPLERPATVLARMARRVQGLALWHDAEVEADWTALGTEWNGLSYDTGFLRRRLVQRHSGRQMRRYAAAVVGGTLIIANPSPVLRALLAIGREVHVGKGATEGFGRFLLS